MNEMQEALEAIEGKVALAQPKLPEGKTLIAIRLERDESRAGRYIEAISRDWQAAGMVVAIKNGHVLAANNIFGRWTNGMPKVSATHFVKCAKCGRRVLMPLAVWEAKDNARRRGVEIDKDVGGMAVLKQHGSCPCGGRWAIDDEGEKAELTAFTEEALKAFEAQATVSPWVGPQAFLVGGKSEPLAPEWAWLQDALAKAGKSVAPFKKDAGGDVVIYNPGLWLGWVDNHDDTNLFWVENGRQKGHGRHAVSAPSFNPGQVDGL
jgi:hypothetical protein